MVLRVKNFSLIVVIFTIFVYAMFPVSVYAASKGSGVSVDASISVETNNAEIANICSQANASVGKLKSKAILVYTSSGKKGLLKFSNLNYSKLDVEDKKIFMETALSATTKTSLNAKTKNRVYNFIASQDTPVTNAMKYLQTDASTDFLEAKKIFDPFSGVVGTVLGVICVAIFLFTGLSILFDIFYLVLPGVQAVLNRDEKDKKPFGVSREAYTALQDSEKDSEYHNVLTLYLKRRVLLLIVMSICIGYLISGQIYNVISYLIDAFSSI